MYKGVIKGGVIVPLEPLPEEWGDGRQIHFDAAGDQEPDDSPEAIDKWYQELVALCAENDPAEMDLLQATLNDMRKESKEMVRREMGLS